MAALLELTCGDRAAAWGALGFAVEDDAVRVGPVAVRCDGAGGGLRGWTLAGTGPREVGGIATTWAPDGDGEVGARALDHVVLTTGRLEATVRALTAVGGDERRRLDVGRGAMAFVRMGAVIVEVVERPGPPALWGLVAVVDDLAELDPALVGEPRDAVQAGRRIATVRRSAGLETAVAFMTPRPGSSPAGGLGRG